MTSEMGPKMVVNVMNQLKMKVQMELLEVLRQTVVKAISMGTR